MLNFHTLVSEEEASSRPWLLTLLTMKRPTPPKRCIETDGDENWVAVDEERGTHLLGVSVSMERLSHGEFFEDYKVGKWLK
jgi:hypothetical protein